MTDSLPAALAAVTADAALHDEFAALCECGGRRAGTPSEQAALKLVHARLAAIDSAAAIEEVAYAGWRCKTSSLQLADGTALACNPLLGSAPTPPDGLDAEVIDLGRGASDDFTRHAADIAGRC